MSQGSAPRQADLFRDTTEFCAPLVRADSIHALLARECHALFPGELFSDLFATGVGRRSVPPLVVAVVMVLQRLEGLSDREAVERFTFDARWKYAAGGLPFDYPGFAHTVLVDMRARLARSEQPNRIFERTLEVARAAGLVGVRRVLDSTPLYDAVATMDTVTLVRSAIRGVLAISEDREPGLRAVIRRDDDYRAGGKPAADWDDAAAREALVDALARDGEAVLEALEGEPLPPPLAEAATLLATVLGQDLEAGPDGRIRIARRVAPTGSSARSTPRPATATRRRPTASTGTRATSRSIPTRSSSPPPPSRRATPATPRSPLRCSRPSWRRPPPPGRRPCTATRRTGRVRCSRHSDSTVL